jgi:hypothetical protein
VLLDEDRRVREHMTGPAFTSQVEWQVGVFRKLGVPAQHEVKDIGGNGLRGAWVRGVAEVGVGETGPDRLINEDHVGDIRPAVWVPCRCVAISSYVTWSKARH